MKKIIHLTIILFCSINIFASENLLTNKHFYNFQDCNIKSIELIEDEGEFLDDPIVKIILNDDKYFCIRHAFSKNPNKLMLYSIDDYDCNYTLWKNEKQKKSERGIYFSYLNLFFDFTINDISDIITHFNEINAFVILLNTYIKYYATNDRQGVYIKYGFRRENKYPGFREVKNSELVFRVWDKNINRIQFEN